MLSIMRHARRIYLVNTFSSSVYKCQRPVLGQCPTGSILNGGLQHRLGITGVYLYLAIRPLAARYFPSKKHLANLRDAFCKHTPAIFGPGKLPNGCLDAHIAKML